MTTTINTPTSGDIIDKLATKSGMSSVFPYPYAFGLAWASLNDEQKIKIMEIVETLEDLEK